MGNSQESRGWEGQKKTKKKKVEGQKTKCNEPFQRPARAMAGVRDWVYFKASTSSTQKYLSHHKNNEIALNRHKFSLALHHESKKISWMSQL